MIVTRQFLSEYLDLQNISNEDIVLGLNNIGFEVERVIDFNKLNTNIVIGKVLSKVAIPESKKLSYCMVDINEDLPVPVICGASNVVENRYVIFAKVGAKLANGLEITSRKMFNRESLGIICSLTELGIFSNALTNEEKDGIYLFPEDETKYLLGDNNPLKYILESDVIFDISLTYNRSDALSSYIIVKELAAYFKLPLKPLLSEELDSFNNIICETLNCSITFDKNIVKGLSFVNLEIDKNIKSPKWLQSRLRFLNIAPINLIQDLLTYVSWETGQPLIGFDNEKINSEVAIKKVTKKFVFQNFNVTIDDYLIMTKDNNIIGVLGIGNDKKYQIQEDTTKITILSLHLDEKIMYSRFKYHNLYLSIPTMMWIKPSNGYNLQIAIQRFLQLLQTIVPIKKLTSLNNKIKQDFKPIVINTNLKFHQNLLGINELNFSDIVKLLTPLGFVIEEKNDDFIVIVPNYRLDIYNETDISEEIARRYGYNNIDLKPAIFPNIGIEIDKKTKVLQIVTSFLINNGIYETKTYNLVNKDYLEKFNFFKVKKSLKVLQPQSKNHTFLRNNLVASLLDVVRYNNLRKLDSIRIYGYEDIYDGFRINHQELSIVLQGDLLSIPYKNQFINIDFLNIKGLLQSIFKKLNFSLQDIKYIKSNHNNLHSKIQSNVFINGKHVATLGQLNIKQQKLWELSSDTYILSLNLTNIIDLYSEKIKYLPLFKNMFLFFDLSLKVEKDLSYEEVVNSLWKVSEKLIDLQLINDYYDDEKLGKNKKSWTIRCIFNHDQQLNHQDKEYLLNEFLNAIQALNLNIEVR